MQSTGLVRLNSLARDLQAIVKELDAGYNPSRDIINKQIKALPGMAESEISGLKATQAESFDNILAGARGRGMGFSGIPIQEQAQYTASQFLPAVARVRQAQNDKQSTLLGALADVNRTQLSEASRIREAELNRDEQIRQFNEQQAAAERARQAAARASSGGFNTGLLNNAPKSTPKAASAARRADGGYNFTDAGGKPISAARYAQLMGKSIGEVLYTMGSSGDQYAQQLYNQLKGDPFFGKGNKAYDDKVKRQYSAIFWGT